ncbi:MAG TPA: S9 family peptidase [Chloroflexota bacterium]|nr:S9 family peptidase [Chloroflexota bacterium]
MAQTEHRAGTTARVTTFPLEDLVRLPDIHYPAVSWDGTRVAYYSDRSGTMELWVQDMAGGAPRQVSNGQLPLALHEGFAWSRAGTAIMFPHDMGGDEQHDLWLLDLATGEATPSTTTPGVQEIVLEFSPNDEWVSFLSTRDGQLNLYKMRPDGSEVTPLTDFANPVVWGGQWSPDGSSLLAAANESADPHNIDVYVVPASGETPRKVFSGGQGTFDFPAGWSSDGRSIALTSDVAGIDRAGLLELESDEVRWFGDGEYEENACALSADGRSLLVLRNREARLLPVLYDLATGAERVPALSRPGSVDRPWDVRFASGGTGLVMKYSADAARPALLYYDLGADEERTLIAPEYGALDPTLLATAEDVQYDSFDGLRIHALLYRPHGLGESGGAPAIVMPHGGPTSQYFHRFDPYIQFLVSQGYAVLAPNIRGSTGYGVKFRDMARLDWGGADLQDVVAGREYLAGLPFVDSNRIGIFGGSYGGFMTYIAVTKAPAAWKAAVAFIGITDLARMYEESMPHFKYFLEEQMGDPESHADLWADRSAANFADRLQARLLIIHGVNDPRCPISQARLFRDRLLAAGRVEGRDFEYVELDEEGHASTDQRQRLRAFRLVSDFLGQNL